MLQHYVPKVLTILVLCYIKYFYVASVLSGCGLRMRGNSFERTGAAGRVCQCGVGKKSADKAGIYLDVWALALPLSIMYKYGKPLQLLDFGDSPA
jgi:hypothetical protein